jgi:hypothetical protein
MVDLFESKFLIKRWLHRGVTIILLFSLINTSVEQNVLSNPKKNCMHIHMSTSIYLGDNFSEFNIKSFHLISNPQIFQISLIYIFLYMYFNRFAFNIFILKFLLSHCYNKQINTSWIVSVLISVYPTDVYIHLRMINRCTYWVKLYRLCSACKTMMHEHILRCCPLASTSK